MRTCHRNLATLLLLGAAACATGDAPAPATIRIWSGLDPDLLIGDISPDGRHLSDVNWASGDLEIIDLESGQARPVTGQGYDAGGYAWMSAFSSDGGRLAVAWYRDSVNAHELRVMNVDGTGARVLLPAQADRYYVEPLDWSADDAELLVATLVADRTWRLGLVSLADGALREVKALGWQTPGGGHDQAYPHADLSPDDRHVAYDYPADSTDPTRDIFAVAVDGGAVTPLVTGPGSDRLLGWLPEGDGILFYSNRSGAPAVWRLPVRDGAPAGEPELVHAGVEGMVALGFTRAGYAYGVAVERQQVHLAAVDPDSGRVIAAPTPIGDPPALTSFAADWSPDGARMAWITHAGPPDPLETLVIATATGQVTRSFPITPALHASNGTFRWTSGDRVFRFAYERGQDGIYEVNLPDGGFRRVTTPDAIGRAAIKWFDVGPDGRTLYLIGRPQGASRENELVALDAVTGEYRVIGTARAIRASLALSPDGGQLAFLARGAAPGELELRVMATTGAANTQVVYRTTREVLAPPLTWTPDGSRIVFERQGADGSSGLWSVGTRGGEPTLLLAGCCRENDARIRADGRRIAFAAGVDRGEVWVLRGY